MNSPISSIGCALADAKDTLGRLEKAPRAIQTLNRRRTQWLTAETRRGTLVDLECDFEESLSSSRNIALANDTGRDDSKIIKMLDVVQVV
jgi:hypothetical protein